MLQNITNIQDETIKIILQPTRIIFTSWTARLIHWLSHFTDPPRVHVPAEMTGKLTDSLTCTDHTKGGERPTPANRRTLARCRTGRGCSGLHTAREPVFLLFLFHIHVKGNNNRGEFRGQSALPGVLGCDGKKCVFSSRMVGRKTAVHFRTNDTHYCVTSDLQILPSIFFCSTWSWRTKTATTATQ